MFLCHFLTLSFLSVAFALILNLPMKSTLAKSNYNEQLHMTAPPAAGIRQGGTAYTHTHTHTHTHTGARAHTAATSAIPYLISIVTEQPPPAQFSPNLLRKQYWYFPTVHNEEEARGRTGGERGKEKRSKSGKMEKEAAADKNPSFCLI